MRIAKIILLMVTLIALAGLLAACKNDTIWGSGWTLRELNGREVIPGTTIVLSFHGDSVDGKGGCNYYSRKVDLTSDTIDFHDGINYEIFCLGIDGVMEQEQAYFQALALAAGYVVNDQTMSISNQYGEVILVFDRGLPEDYVPPP